MRDYENYKIPYDSEPIYRQNVRKKQSARSASFLGQGSSKLVSLLVCVLLVFNIILGIVVFSNLDKKSSSINNIEYNINSENIDVEAVVAKAQPSVVLVHAGLNDKGTSNVDYNYFFDKMQSKGSGVIIQDDKEAGQAYILTCYHVIRPAVNEIYVLLSDSFVPIKATRVYTSLTYDLAVIEIDKSDEASKNEYKKSSCKPCEVADSTFVTLGEGVVAIGNPLGKGLSVTNGIISVTSEMLTVSGSSYQHRVMRISSPINVGNSGGGLFNAKGELLGIVSAKLEDTPSVAVDCIGYAIPSTLAINFAGSVIRNSTADKAVIGLTLNYDSSVVDYEYVDGKKIATRKVFVTNVEEGSPAYKAGINVGDRLVSFTFNGKLVNVINMFTLEDYVFAMQKGDEVTFVVERSGSQIEKTLTIAETVRADN